MSDPIEKATEWLLSMQQEDGSVLAGTAEDKQYSYSEIVGYFIKFCFKYGLTAEGTKSANYLLKHTLNGFMPWKVDRAGNPDPYTYSFDTAIMADSLMDVFEYSYQSKWYNTAAMMMNRLKAMQEQLGHIPTMFSRDGRAWNDPTSYYRIPAAHYIKLIPIFQRFGLKTDYLERFIKLQRNDGAFHCSPMTRYVFSHFHAYALDGLENQKTYEEEYRQGALWAKDNLLKGTKRVPAWSSDRSWSMPGANLQLAYHLNNVGEHNLAKEIRDTALADQTEEGGIPIRTEREPETWCTLFVFLYSF